MMKCKTLILQVFAILLVFVSSSLTYDFAYDEVIYEEPLNVPRGSLYQDKRIKFNALNRTFELVLKKVKDNVAFKENSIEVDNLKIPIDLDMYEGVLYDDVNSRVHGSIIDSHFHGTIYSTRGNYIIEAKENGEGTLIYNEKDVKLPSVANGRLRSTEGECGNDRNHEWMETIAKRDYADNTKFKVSSSPPVLNPFPNGRNTCSIYFKVDSAFYSEFFNNEGNKNANRTIRLILAYLQNSILFLNSRFQEQIRDANGNSVRFMVYRVKIITPELCGTGKLSKVDEILCTSESITELQYLRFISQDLDFVDYCLGYGFTARDFGTALGIAWLPSSDARSWQGACSSEVGLIEQKNSTTNVGIVTRKHLGLRTPQLSSMITFVHEVGHSFSSEHDKTSECVPSFINGGAYIMFRSSLDGSKPNNLRYSPCSQSQIITFLNNLQMGKNRKFCFVSSASASFCGNGLVEPGEECDCGFNDTCTDKCCFSASDRLNGCKLRPNAQCSPSQGFCCSSDTCSFLSPLSICSPASTCLKDVYCTGRTAACPTTDPAYFAPLENGQPKACNENTQVCKSGECGGSICEKFGMNECPSSGDLNARDDQGKLCTIFCDGGPQKLPCTISSSLVDFNRTFGAGVAKLSGAICGNSSEGFCDLDGKCKVYNVDSDLETLARLLFNASLTKDLQALVLQYWWVVFLGFILLFVLTVGLICVYRFVKTDNPLRVVRESAEKSKKDAKRMLQESTSASHVRSRKIKKTLN